MDIASLRRELDEHLKSHPHQEAPEGFRDRFEHWAEAYEAETDEEAKAGLADLLRRIPSEAEAACRCGIAEPESADDVVIPDDRPPESEAPPPPESETPPQPVSEAPLQSVAKTEEEAPPAPAPETGRERPPRLARVTGDEAPREADSGPAGGDSAFEVPMTEPAERTGAGAWLLLAAIVLALAAAAYFYLAR